MRSPQEDRFQTRYSRSKVALIVSGSTEAGGAERLYSGLYRGLNDLGIKTEMISVPADEPDFETILKNYEYCRGLDLSAFDVVISTKAPTYAVKHPCHVMYLVHTVRVFEDMFYHHFQSPSPDLYMQRSKLHKMDLEAFSGLKAGFAIGNEVSRRLYRWHGIDTRVVHPPFGISGFRSALQEDYFFLPGRLHPWKRVDLVIESIKGSSLPMRLVITGTGEDEKRLRKLAGNDPRIEFTGRVSDEKLLDLYSNCLAVPFIPIHEDYGYITLEAFASEKPVITCSDSGEPAFFVEHKKNGLISEPDPEALRRSLEWIYQNRQEARVMGKKGFHKIPEHSWENVAEILVNSGLSDSCENAVAEKKKKIQVSVLDMQPIDPPVGGGRLRLLGLYHNLGDDFRTSYIGSYDWPGEEYRNHMLSDNLEETDIPLSHQHHQTAGELSVRANGKTVIDISFGRLGTLSPSFVEKAEQSVKESDILIFSHPWVYPLVEKHISPNQFVVYDSHNVEGYLRAQLLNDKDPVEEELLRYVVEVEYNLGRRADLIFACSQEDLLRFNRIYDFPHSKIRIVPNGVMAFSGSIVNRPAKEFARKKLGISEKRFIAVFIGSPYGPNVEAAGFIIDKLAPALPQTTFVIAGGVGAVFSTSRENVILTGQIEEKEKMEWLSASDIAINPMFSGSGTNIKMFDFMVFELPVVTTLKGARGIDTGYREAVMIVEPEVRSFISAINRLRNSDMCSLMGKEARASVEEGYSWERISMNAGHILQSRYNMHGQQRPFFSVVIPTYERHSNLDTLIKCLKDQIERDFEVVIVDQSSSKWHGSNREYGFPFQYIHSPVKGAVRARNTGAAIAQGKIIAFVDDDCLPRRNWLINAKKYFSDTTVVGVEGKILSDHIGEPDWRPVTNSGFEGIGFMTANLFVMNSVFTQSGGFDLRFDSPHFREDTDLGWRLQEYGFIPFAEDAEVFHPAMPRSNNRESHEERSSFFQKDALLYEKHPDKYRQLFLKERHFQGTPGFKENLIAGFRNRGIPVPEWISEHLNIYSSVTSE